MILAEACSNSFGWPQAALGIGIAFAAAIIAIGFFWCMK